MSNCYRTSRDKVSVSIKSQAIVKIHCVFWMSPDYSWPNAEDSLLPTSCSRGWHMPWCRSLQVFTLISFTKAALPAVSALSVSFLCTPSSLTQFQCYSESAYASVTEISTVGPQWQFRVTWQKGRSLMSYNVKKLQFESVRFGNRALLTLTSDFRNNLDLVSCCSYAFLVP